MFRHVPTSPRRSRRALAVLVGGLLAIVPLPAPGPAAPASAGPDGGPTVEILEETPLIGEFVAEGGVTDDVVVMWDEVLDPRFMPDPADFTVTINTVPSDPTAVDLLFSGLARSDFEFGADGISFMQLDLPAGVTYGANDTVTISYTPTVTPVRDLALNESTGFPDTAVTAVEISGIFHLISVVDSYHGADKLVLSLTEPVEPSSLPALSQFTVDVGGTPVGVLGVDDLSPDVGMALIELTLDLSEVTISQSSIVTFDYAGSETTLVGEFSGQPLETLNDVQAELFIANNAAAAPDSLAGQELTTATPEGPTAADPVATTIVPAADGFVSISESTVEAEPPSGYEFFGHQVEITMPDAPSPEEPNVLTFVLDASIIPAGQDEMSIQLFRDGVLVPDCMGDPGVADPTPCISERVALDDGDISLTALTVQASSWNLGVVRPFEFGGFLAPVDGEVPHIARAGRAIPVRFSLGGDQGLDIFVDGSPSSQSISCDSVDDGDVVEETVTVGNSSLTYDAETDTYSYVWKTRSEWADTCRRLVLDFADGSTWTAVFDFRR